MVTLERRETEFGIAAVGRLLSDHNLIPIVIEYVSQRIVFVSL